jgi:tetratricopeptide (TPR) repeat protein
MSAMLLVSLPLVAIAGEKPAPLMIDQALPAIEDGDLTSEVVELDGSAAKSLGIAQDHVLLVVLSPKDRPSEKAGLKSGDVIFALNGQPAPNLDGFTAAVKRAGSGGEVSLGVWRQGERTTFQVRLGSTSGAMIPVGIEQEIEAYTAIGKIFGERGFPAIWGFIQCKLGALYWIRVEGRSEDNIETAIAAYNSALTVLTREAFPQQWARTENDLALAYTDRVHGSRAENLEDAIRAYQAALTVLTRERSPGEWAQIQNCLGLAYMDRIEGNREDNVDAAIDSYKTTLLVLDKEAFPQDWARLQKNLGQAYRARLRGERAENLKAAADADEAALTVLSQTIPTPPDAINPAPQEVSAKLESQQTEPKAIAKPAAAEGEPQPLVNEAKSSGQPAGAFKQAPGEENSTGLGQAAPIVAETVQTDPTQPADRLATKPDTQLQKLSAEQEDTMLKRASTLLSQNDIAGARLILQYLANHGSVGGAFALGESYDPKKWASHRVIGMTPDEDLARSWYARAAEIGNREPAAILRKEKP